jgi:ornithine carbamoyltransferase
MTTWSRRAVGSRPIPAARLTLTDDVDEGVGGVDYLHTDVRVSMGEAHEVWEERIGLLRPSQVNTEVVRRSGNPKVTFLHCLPAFHDRETKGGEEIFAKYGLDGLGSPTRCPSPSIRSSSTRPRSECRRSRL